MDHQQASQDMARLKRQLGKLDDFLAPHAEELDEDSIVRKQSRMRQFEEQATTIHRAIVNLEDGIKTTEERTREANELALEQVNRQFEAIFARVVPGKRAVLRQTGPLVEVRNSLGAGSAWYLHGAYAVLMGFVAWCGVSSGVKRRRRWQRRQCTASAAVVGWSADHDGYEIALLEYSEL